MIRRILTIAFALSLVPFLAFGQNTVPQATGAIAGSGGGTNPAYVQGSTGFTASATNVSATLSAVGAGHGLFVYCMAPSSACAAPTATGESFSTYTGTSGCQDFGGYNVQCWLATSTVGGETSLTCNTGGGTSAIFCIVIEFTRPQALATPKDAGGHNNTAGSTNSWSVSTSAATTNANDFVIGCFGSVNIGNNTITVGSPFTQPAAASISNSSGEAACGYLVASSTGTQTATGSATSNMTNTNGVILAVKP